jgi:hypothetical protein
LERSQLSVEFLLNPYSIIVIMGCEEEHRITAVKVDKDLHRSFSEEAIKFANVLELSLFDRELCAMWAAVFAFMTRCKRAIPELKEQMLLRLGTKLRSEL